MPVSREQRILGGIAVWASYYRANPDKFAADYLHLDLRPFQKILLVMMNLVANFVFIGSRGKPLPLYIVIYKVQRGRNREG